MTHPVYLRIREPTTKHTHEKTQEELEKEKKRATETDEERESNALIEMRLACISPAVVDRKLARHT